MHSYSIFVCIIAIINPQKIVSAIHQIVTHIHRQLSGDYPLTEIDSFIRIMFQHYLHMSSLDMHLQANSEISTDQEAQIQTVVDELKKYRPIQYILGETEFFGLKLKLMPDVLIPRPETEELVDLVIRRCTLTHQKAACKILDIGTGSGCIAIALAANLNASEVWAMDISELALAIAKENAKMNHVSLRAVQGDILSDDVHRLFPEKYFDIIISNPPYVTSAEKQLMHPNVLAYEPHLALFTPDYQPLIFYEHIARFGWKHLSDGGRIYFEINEAYRQETMDVLAQFGYDNIMPHKDINAKWRMMEAQKPITINDESKG